MTTYFKKLKLLFIFFLILLQPIFIFALEYPKIDSKIVEIYDLNDKKIIYEVDSEKIVSIASLTKIVTTMTAIENISNLNEEVVITKDILNTVRWDASKAGLHNGDKVTYMDLLYASMLPSGADATNSIAILSSGSIDKFVLKMNKFASNLGLKNTHFVNVTGLDEEGHYSTADDVRKILEYALKNELFRKIYTTKEYTLKNGLKVESTIAKYNSSSIDTSHILGSKTGYTGEAGYCLSSLSNINSHEFIIIVLNASHKNNQYYHIIDTTKLIEFLLDNFKDEILVKKNEVIKEIPVQLSKTEVYKIVALNDIKKYLPSDYDKNKLRIQYDGLDQLSFRNKVGEVIGTITYYYDDEKIIQDSILLRSKLEIDVWKVIKKYYYIGIIGIILFISIIVIIKKRKFSSK